MPEYFSVNPLAEKKAWESDYDIFRKYYGMGYLPYDSRTEWVERRCVDCRLYQEGAVLEKPLEWQD